MTVRQKPLQQTEVIEPRSRVWSEVFAEPHARACRMWLVTLVDHTGVEFGDRTVSADRRQVTRLLNETGARHVVA